MTDRKGKSTKRRAPEVVRQDSDSSNLTIIITDDKELFTKEFPGGYVLKLIFDEFANDYRIIIRKVKPDGDKFITLTLPELEATLQLSAMDYAISMGASETDDDDETGENLTIPILVKKKSSLRYKVNNFMGVTYIHIRRFYWGKSREDPNIQWRPTMSGVCCDKDTFQSMISSMTDILETAKKSSAFERNLVKNAAATFVKESIRKDAEENCGGCQSDRSETDNSHFANNGCRSNWEKRVKKDFTHFFSLIHKETVLEMCHRYLEMREMQAKSLSPIFDSEIMKEFPIKDVVVMQMENSLVGNLKTFYEEYVV